MQKNREDYLRAMYVIADQSDGSVKSVDIAKYMNVSKPAVSEMLKKLKLEKYIRMEPYSKIVLTAKGYKEAQKLTFKHRVSELFLREVLQMDESEIHEEAHKLEHAFSDKVIKKLAEYMGAPSTCPHGNVIPNIKF
jgi:DtxR family Mn-dependent transcriptional regulator